MYDVDVVSNYFIKKGVEDNFDFEGISPLKLQKLLYYAQSWHSVLNGSPLFEEEIQAWVHGPVIKKVYDQYKEYGYHPITRYKKDKIKNISEETEKVLEAVWNMYGGLTGKELEKLTHSEPPWKLARNGLHPLKPSQRNIPVDSLKDYYSQFIVSEA